MILRMVIYDSKVTRRAHPKHSFIWKEGEETGTLLQHVNAWVHPTYTWDMFQTVLRVSLRKHNDTVMVFYWNSAAGHWLDLD